MLLVQWPALAQDRRQVSRVQSSASGDRWQELTPVVLRTETPPQGVVLSLNVSQRCGVLCVLCGCAFVHVGVCVCVCSKALGRENILANVCVCVSSIPSCGLLSVSFMGSWFVYVHICVRVCVCVC